MSAKRSKFLVLIAAWVATAVLLVAGGCGLGPLGSSNAKPTQVGAIPGMTTLWPDVPEFTGATPDAVNNAFMNQFLTSADANVTYYTDKQPADVAAFYTNDLMKTQGWQPSSYAVVSRFSVGHGEGPQPHTNATGGGCALLTDKNPPEAFCTFNKDQDGKHVELSIEASVDSKTHQTRLIYSRMTGSGENK